MGIFDKVRARMVGAAAKDGESPEADISNEKLESASDQTTDELKLVAYIKDKIDETRTASNRSIQESTWMTNTAYLVGYDGVQYDSQTKQFKNISTTSKAMKKDRIRVNKILPTVQNRTARLCKVPPKYEIRPESNAEEDKDAARKGLHLIDSVWDKQHVDEKRIGMVNWLQQCGHAYMFASWDDELGEPMIQEGPDGTTELVDFEGDIRIDVASAFEVYVDPLAKTMEEATWVIRTKVRKLNYFKDRYPERGDLVKEEDAWLLSTQYEMRLNSITNQSTSSGSQGMMKDAAIEITYYEKRSKKHPHGRQVVTANGILLDNKPLPIGEIPCAKFDDIMVGGKFSGEAVITHLRPVQDYFNENVRKRVQFLRMHLAGKFLSPRGAGLHPEALDNESGEVLEYDPVPNASEPHQLQQPVIPEYAFREEQSCNQWINDISGINEVSRGTLPSASIPALGMRILQEADETRMGIMLEQHQHAYAHLARFILKFGDKFYITPRKVKLQNDSIGYNVTELKAGDIKGNYDVCVVSGSMSPRSKALKNQDITNALSLGVFNIADPAVREMIIDALEFGDTDELFKEHSVVMAQIKNDMEMIKKGDIPQVNELDKHALHVFEKNQYRIENDINNFLSPMSKMILDQNIEAHLQAAVSLANPSIGQSQDLAKEMVQSSNDPNTAQQASSLAHGPGSPAHMGQMASSASPPPMPPMPGPPSEQPAPGQG